MPSGSGCPDRSSTLFIETSALLNYIKTLMLKGKGINPPTRAVIIREFIIKCFEKQLKLQTSSRVYEQAKYYRNLIRKELLKQGFGIYRIERLLRIAERKIKQFLLKLKVHENLSNREYTNVEAFFRRYQKDPRCIKVWVEKSQRDGIKLTSPIPERSDIEIFAQALTLPDLFFLNTDDHFGVLNEEIEKEFGVGIIHHDNALGKIREWGW